MNNIPVPMKISNTNDLFSVLKRNHAFIVDEDFQKLKTSLLRLAELEYKFHTEVKPMDKTKSEKYGNEIVCESCKKLLGFAPYYRDEYRCIECNVISKSNGD